MGRIGGVCAWRTKIAAAAHAVNGHPCSAMPLGTLFHRRASGSRRLPFVRRPAHHKLAPRSKLRGAGRLKRDGTDLGDESREKGHVLKKVSSRSWRKTRFDTGRSRGPCSGFKENQKKIRARVRRNVQQKMPRSRLRGSELGRGQRDTPDAGACTKPAAMAGAFAGPYQVAEHGSRGAARRFKIFDAPAVKCARAGTC